MSSSTESKLFAIQTTHKRRHNSKSKQRKPSLSLITTLINMSSRSLKSPLSAESSPSLQISSSLSHGSNSPFSPSSQTPNSPEILFDDLTREEFEKHHQRMLFKYAKERKTEQSVNNSLVQLSGDDNKTPFGGQLATIVEKPGNIDEFDREVISSLW